MAEAEKFLLAPDCRDYVADGASRCRTDSGDIPCASLHLDERALTPRAAIVWSLAETRRTLEALIRLIAAAAEEE